MFPCRRPAAIGGAPPAAPRPPAAALLPAPSIGCAGQRRPHWPAPARPGPAADRGAAPPLARPRGRPPRSPPAAGPAPFVCRRPRLHRRFQPADFRGCFFPPPRSVLPFPREGCVWECFCCCFYCYFVWLGFFFLLEECRQEFLQHPWSAGAWGGGGDACGGKRDRFWLGYFYYTAAKQSEMLADFKTS